jgi:hypothetical protein
MVTTSERIVAQAKVDKGTAHSVADERIIGREPVYLLSSPHYLKYMQPLQKIWSVERGLHQYQRFNLA